MAEHGLDGSVIEIFVAFHHGVAEIRQGAQPRAVDGVDHLNQEEGILGDQVVVLQVDHDILRGSVNGQLLQAFRRAAYVGRRASGSLDMDANAGRADRHGYVHPFLAARDGFVAMGGIGIVQAAADAGGDVHDVRMGLLDRAPEFVQVGWLGGWKMPAEGLDVMDAKLLHDHGGEIGQLDTGVAGPVHEIAEGVGSYSQPVARRGRKVDIGRRGGAGLGRGGRSGTGFDEGTTGDGWHGSISRIARRLKERYYRESCERPWT
jgi:hypothetical protein